jgi:hypothetical protein
MVAYSMPKHVGDWRMRLGDAVADRAGLKGRVVANIDRDEFSAECPKEEWAYLNRGLLVETEEAGLIHYENTEELTLIGDL